MKRWIFIFKRQKTARSEEFVLVMNEIKNKKRRECFTIYQQENKDAKINEQLTLCMDGEELEICSADINEMSLTLKSRNGSKHTMMISDILCTKTFYFKEREFLPQNKRSFF